MTTLDLSPPIVLPHAEQSSLRNRILAWLFAPIAILPLVYFRVFFGAIMVWEVSRYFEHDWIKRYFIDPNFFFTFYGFDWVRPLPGDAMYTYFHIVGVLAFCILIGVAYRVVMPLFFLTFTYWFLLDQTNYLNHFYLVSLISLLLCFAPAHRKFSVDALLRPKIRVQTVPRWSLAMFLLQLGLVYFFGGIAKLNGDWLRGEPMRSWLADRTDFPLIGQWFTQEWVVAIFVFGGLLIDLLAFPALLWRRTRWLAVAALICFHLLNNRLFNIGIFPWFMLATLPLFFPLAWWEKLNKLNHRDPEDTEEAEQKKPFKVSPIVLTLLGVYFAWQILMPLRHFLYPGDVSWTEEGHNFSWHMKLRDKEAVAKFTIYDPDSARSWAVDLTDYLTTRQASQMPQHPDMVLLFAHYLRDRWRDDGYENVHIYAEVVASLNGRPYQHLIDPLANLSVIERTPFKSAFWIMPLQQPLFAETRQIAQN